MLRRMKEIYKGSRDGFHIEIDRDNIAKAIEEMEIDLEDLKSYLSHGEMRKRPGVYVITLALTMLETSNHKKEMLLELLGLYLLEATFFPPRNTDFEREVILFSLKNALYRQGHDKRVMSIVKALLKALYSRAKGVSSCVSAEVVVLDVAKKKMVKLPVVSAAGLGNRQKLAAAVNLREWGSFKDEIQPVHQEMIIEYIQNLEDLDKKLDGLYFVFSFDGNSLEGWLDLNVLAANLEDEYAVMEIAPWNRDTHREARRYLGVGHELRVFGINKLLETDPLLNSESIKNKIATLGHRNADWDIFGYDVTLLSVQEYLGEQRAAREKYISDYGLPEDFKENASSAVEKEAVSLVLERVARHRSKKSEKQPRRILVNTVLKSSSPLFIVAIDFDQTMSAKDTVLAWAEMIQWEKGCAIDDYLRRKRTYAEFKTKENLANEYSFFKGRPKSDLIKLAQEIELNPKFLDAVKLIKETIKINSLTLNIVSAGLKNIIEAFLNRGEIEEILRKEGITIGTIKANQLVVKDEKFTNEFKDGIITGPEKADFIASGTLYIGDDSDEKNLSGKIEFLVNIYWLSEKIESAVRDCKEKISKAVRQADKDEKPYKIKERGPGSPLLPGEFLVKFNSLLNTCPRIVKRLLKTFHSLNMEGLDIGSKQYLLMSIFYYYLGEEKTIAEISEPIQNDIQEVREIERRYAFLPNTGCEIGFPLILDNRTKENIRMQADLDGKEPHKGVAFQEKILEQKAYILRDAFNFFMRVNSDDTIPGVRPSDREGPDNLDLRILPGKHPVTIKILDLYIKKMRLFSDYELITSSYATTVEGLLDEWYMSLICAVSFFLDRVYDDRAWTGGEIVPTSAEGLGQPGAMIWKAVNPKAETSKAVRGSKVTAVHRQTTFNYHMLGIGFEEMVTNESGVKERKLKVFFQYPQDYSRMPYLVYVAKKAQIIFEREFIQPLNIFCLKRLGVNILKLKRRSNPPTMYYSFYSLKVVGAGIVIALLRDLYADSKFLSHVFNFILVIILGNTVKVYLGLVFRILRDLHKHKDLIGDLASLLQKGLHRHPNGQERAYKEQVALLKEFQRAADEGIKRIKENIHKTDTGKDSIMGRNSSPLIYNTRRKKQIEPAIVPLPVPKPEQAPEEEAIPEEPLEVPGPIQEPVEAVFAASSLSIRGLWVKIRDLRMNITYGMIIAAILAYSVWQTAPPPKAKYSFDLGFYALRQARYEDAVSLFQQFLSLSKNPRQIILAHNGLAFSYEKLGRAKEALNHLKTAFEIDPDYYVTFFIFAEMLYKHGNIDCAVLMYAAGLSRVAEPELFIQRLIGVPDDILEEVILRLAELWNQEIEKRLKKGKPVSYSGSPLDDLRLIRLLEARAADAFNIIRYNLRFIDDNKARFATWKFCTDASYIFARALNKLLSFSASQAENDGFLVEGVAVDFLGKREAHLRIRFNYRGRARLIIDPTYAQFDRAYINKIRIDRADMPGPLSVIPLKDYYAELYGEYEINKALDEIMSKLEDYSHIHNSGGFLTDLQLKVLFLAKCQLLARGEIDKISPDYERNIWNRCSDETYELLLSASTASEAGSPLGERKCPRGEENRTVPFSARIIRAAGSALVKKLELNKPPAYSLLPIDLGSFKAPEVSLIITNKSPPLWTIKAFNFAFNGSNSLLLLLIIPPDFIPAVNRDVFGLMIPHSVLPGVYCLFLRTQSPYREENINISVFSCGSSPLGKDEAEMKAVVSIIDIDAADKLLRKEVEGIERFVDIWKSDTYISDDVVFPVAYQFIMSVETQKAINENGVYVFNLSRIKTLEELLELFWDLVDECWTRVSVPYQEAYLNTILHDSSAYKDLSRTSHYDAEDFLFDENIYMHLDKDDLVLDVGAGCGAHIARIIAKKVKKVYGTEISPKIITQAQKHIQEEGITNIELQLVRNTRLPYENNLFDKIIISRFFFNLMPKMRMRMLDSISRVLKPEGILIIRTYLVRSELYWDVYDWKEYLEKSGFKVNRDSVRCDYEKDEILITVKKCGAPRVIAGSPLEQVSRRAMRLTKNSRLLAVFDVHGTLLEPTWKEEYAQVYSF